MFTWICPKCGREVPPAYTECPDCERPQQAPAAGPGGPIAEHAAPEPVAVPAATLAGEPLTLDKLERLSKLKSLADAGVITAPEFEREKARLLEYAPAAVGAAAPPRSAPPPPPPTPVQAAPPPPPPPPSPSAAPPPPGQPESSLFGAVYKRSYEPAPATPAAPRRGLPTWLLVVVFALAFLGLVAGVYWLVGYMHGSNAGPAAVVESPASKPGEHPNPYQKYVEISGVRFMEDARKKPEVKFAVTNHSPADISGLSGNVTIWGRTRKSEEEAAGTFHFTTDIGPWESKDLTVPLTTKLELIELPDWQNVSTDVQITGPAQ